MTDQVFTISSFTLNPHAFSPLLASIISFFLGVTVLIQKRLSWDGICFLIISITVSIWLFSGFWVLSSTVETVTLFWVKITFCGICFIPPTIYQHAILVVGKLKEYRVHIIFSWLISIARTMALSKITPNS